MNALILTPVNLTPVNLFTKGKPGVVDTPVSTMRVELRVMFCKEVP